MRPVSGHATPSATYSSSFSRIRVTVFTGARLTCRYVVQGGGTSVLETLWTDPGSTPKVFNGARLLFPRVPGEEGGARQAALSRVCARAHALPARCAPREATLY